jgi:hypothetical protein
LRFSIIVLERGAVVVGLIAVVHGSRLFCFTGLGRMRYKL